MPEGRRAALFLLLAAVGIAPLAGCSDPPREDPGGSAADDDTSPADDDAGPADDDAGGDDDSTPAGGPPYTLETTPSASDVAAGDRVELHFLVRDSEGVDVTAQVAVAVTVDPPEGAVVAGPQVVFTSPGTYEVLSSVSWDGGEARDTDAVHVRAGEAASLRLTLDRHRVVAGEAVVAAMEVVDAHGNPVESPVEISVEPPAGATVDGATIVATVAGDAVVLASAEGGALTASASLAVDPGPAATVSVVLPAYEAEVGDGLTADVVQADAYGNPSQDDVLLATVPATGASAWGRFVRFDAEGIYEVVATSEVSGVTGSDGPVVVDSSGPALNLHTPPRGAQLPTGPTQVAGTASDAVSGLDVVRVNGGWVPVVMGSFNTSVTAAFGLNVLQAEATDQDGNGSDAAISFLAGGFLPEGAWLEDALVARIGEEGIDQLEGVALSALDVGALLDGMADAGTPVFSTGSCTTASATLYVTGAAAGDTTVDLDPKGGGYIQLSASVADLEIDFEADYSTFFCLVNGTAVGTMSADRVDISARLNVAVSGGEVVASLSDVTATFVGFDISGDLASEIVSLFDDFIVGYAEDAVVDAIEAEVAPMLEDVFSDLALATTLDLAGIPLSLEAVPHDARVDETGLTLALESRVTGPSSPGLPDLEGSLWREPAWPSYGSGDAFHLSIADNFINQVLTAVWRAGALEMDLAGGDLGLDLGSLGPLLGLSELSIAVTPLLPPVLVPRDDGTTEYDLQVGEMKLDLRGDPGGVPSLLAEIRVALQAPAAVTVADGGIAIAVGDPAVWLDVVGSDHPVDAELLEGVMEDLLASLLPEMLSVLDALAGIPIPEMEGFTLLSPSLSRDDDPYNYLTLSGDVVIDLAP
ncbi:hypothetical protein L6R50_25435 [Myxococcota bacterium]|nr:hypothetical protein [Myxococcota bacterium]